MPNVERVQDNERIDRGDFEFAVDTTPQAFGRQLGANALTNPAGARLWILGGFDITNPAAAQCRVTRGVALLSQREAGEVAPGVLAFEGDATKTVDLAAYANGTYGVYVRFEYNDGEFQNRIFWNPAVPPGAEAAQSIATRRIANWGMRVESVSPGAEWFHIADAAVNAGAITGITKKRKFFFEGDENAAYAATVSLEAGTYRAWGSGNDRNADRALYGVQDLQTFTAAMRSQLASLLGQAWYATPTEALNQKVSRNGDLALTGNYKITGALNVTGHFTIEGGSDILAAAANSDVGSTGQRFAAAFLSRFDVGGADPVSDIENTSTGFGKIHFFETGSEATKFFDIGYSGASGIASYNTGTGGGLGGSHVFGVDGTVVMSVGVAGQGGFGLGSGIPATFQDDVNHTGGTLASVNGDFDLLSAVEVDSDLIPEGASGARKLGSSTNRWDAFIDALDAAGDIATTGAVQATTIRANTFVDAAGNDFVARIILNPMSAGLIPRSMTAAGDNYGTYKNIINTYEGGGNTATDFIWHVHGGRNGAELTRLYFSAFPSVAADLTWNWSVERPSGAVEASGTFDTGTTAGVTDYASRLVFDSGAIAGATIITGEPLIVRIQCIHNNGGAGAFLSIGNASVLIDGPLEDIIGAD